MSDSINTSIDNFNINYEALVTANLETVQGPAKIKDTAAVSQTNNEQYVYTPPGAPRLPAPGENTDPMGMTNLADMLQNFVGDVMAASNMVPTPDTSFVDEAEEEIEGLSDEAVKDMNTGLPADQTVKMIRYSVFNPDADMPESIKNAADTIREKTTAATGQEPSSFMATLNNKSAEVGYSALLKSAIMNLGLSAADQQMLLAAHDMPEFAADLSPEMQTMLANAEKAAFAGVQKDVGVPDNWKVPRDAEAYKTGVSDSLEQKIGDKLYEKFMDGNISRATYNDLRTLLYIPGSSPPNAAALKPMLAQIQGESLKEVQTKWGFPTSYQPTINSHDYTAILTGGFYASASKAIAAQTPPLSASDQALLKSALSSPAAAESLPAKLKEVLSTVTAAATAKIIKQYGLPDNWAPDAVMLGNAEKANTPNIQLAQTVLNFGQEFTAKATQIAKIQVGTAAGSDGVVAKVNTSIGNKLINYLKVVSQALALLQESLSAQSVVQANLSKLVTRIEADANLGRIAAQKKSLDEVKAKEAKMATMGPFKLLFMIILLIILTIFLGPFGFMLAMALIVNSAVQEKGNLANMDVFADAAKTFTEIGTAIGGPAVGKALAAALMMLMIAFCPILLLCDLMFGQGTSISTILKGFGVSDQVAAYITMAIQIIFIIVTIVIMAIIAPEFIAGEVGVLVSSVTAKIGSMVPKVIINALNFAIQGVEKAGAASSEAVKVLSDVVRAALTKIKNFIRSDYISTSKAFETAKEAKVALNNAQHGLQAAKSNLSSLRNAGTIKDIREAEVAVKKAEETLKFSQSAFDKADSVAAKVKGIKETIYNAEKEVEAKFEKLRDAKAAGQGVQQAKADLKVAQKSLVKAEDDAMDYYTSHVANELEEVGKTADAAQLELKTAKTARKTAENVYNDAKDTLTNYQEIYANAVKSGDKVLEQSAKDMVGKQQKAVNSLSDAYREAKDTESVASHAMNLQETALNNAADKALKPIQDVATVTDMVNNTIQGSMQVNNNIIQAQIAILKGDLEAYLVNIETFITILKQLISKLLKSLQGLGQDIASIGQSMQDNWTTQTQAMTALSRAM